MKRLAFAVGVFALGFTASTPARADFAVVKFEARLLPDLVGHRREAVGRRLEHGRERGRLLRRLGRARCCGQKGHLQVI